MVSFHKLSTFIYLFVYRVAGTGQQGAYRGGADAHQLGYLAMTAPLYLSHIEHLLLGRGQLAELAVEPLGVVALLELGIGLAAGRGGHLEMVCIGQCYRRRAAQGIESQATGDYGG